MTDANGITIMATAAVKEAFRELVPQFEGSKQCRVTPLWMPTVDMLRRLDGGEVVDLILLTGETIDELTAKGIVAPGSRTDIMKSSVGMAVRAGAPKPDIRTVEALTRALRTATSVAYSASASGVYLSTELFPRLGLADAMRQKGRRIESERVAAVVARGDAELGFQQVSELLPVAGVDYVGPLPDGAQRITVFSAGIGRRATAITHARALIAFLQSAEAAALAATSGLDPIPAAAPASQTTR